MSLNTFLKNYEQTLSAYKIEKKDYNTIDPYNTFKCGFSFNTTSSSIQFLSAFKDTVANMGFKTDDNTNTEIEYGFEKYVQTTQLPNFSVVNDTAADTIAGSFQTHKLVLVPESPTFVLDILNTSKPILENIFLPWLREIQSPKWVYIDRPYTKATFTIDMNDHNNLTYVFLGCRPTNIASISPSHDLPSSITRQVTFTFDFMYATRK